MDINKTDIILEFRDELEKNNFIDNLKKRKELLEIFKNQIRNLEEMRNSINYIYEEFMSMSGNDIPK